MPFTLVSWTESRYLMVLDKKQTTKYFEKEPKKYIFNNFKNEFYKNDEWRKCMHNNKKIEHAERLEIPKNC